MATMHLVSPLHELPRIAVPGNLLERLSPVRGACASLLGRLRRIWGRLPAHVARSVTHREGLRRLRALDDHMLKDIGLMRADLPPTNCRGAYSHLDRAREKNLALSAGSSTHVSEVGMSVSGRLEAGSRMGALLADIPANARSSLPVDTPRARGATWAQRVGCWLRWGELPPGHWVDHRELTSAEAYLAQAVNLCELEQRMRSLDRHRDGRP